MPVAKCCTDEVLATQRGCHERIWLVLKTKRCEVKHKGCSVAPLFRVGIKEPS